MAMTGSIYFQQILFVHKKDIMHYRYFWF